MGSSLVVIFPAIAVVIATFCAAVIGYDALKRPRPERTVWSLAFLVFAVAAGAEVVGSTAGWTASLTRVFYLAGAVLVVGLLALGELYLLFPNRVPVATPGVALLIVAVATTAVWSAPVDAASLQTHGWGAIERGPFLVALAASINAGGTVVLVGGAIYSAWTLRESVEARRRALGCVLIAVGTIVVATGGTLTRFGHREYLYVPMAIGVAVIFGGVLMTRGRGQASGSHQRREVAGDPGGSSPQVHLVPLPVRPAPLKERDGAGDGHQFIVKRLLPLGDEEIAAACRRWSATSIEGEVLTRVQAKQVWALRCGLPKAAVDRFDALPFQVQAQLAELYAEVWSGGIDRARAAGTAEDCIRLRYTPRGGNSRR